MKRVYLIVIALLLMSCDKSVHSHTMWKYNDGVWVGDILHTPSQIKGETVYHQKTHLPTAKIIKIESHFFGSDVLIIEDLKTGEQGVYLSIE